jgi:hypothetical protein
MKTLSENVARSELGGKRKGICQGLPRSPCDVA